MKEWVFPALGTFIFWGFWGFIPKLTTKYISPKSAIVYEVVGGFLVAIMVLYSLNFRPEMNPKGFALAITTGVFGFLGALCYLLAVSKGPVSLVVTLTALYPVLSILLAVIILNEPITLKQGVGILLALGAMLLIVT